MKKLILLSVLATFFSCNTSAQKKETIKQEIYKSDAKLYVVYKSEGEWKSLLSSQQYYVLRQEGTERPFSSPLDKNYEEGVYVCVACNTPLFKSEYKFDSGTGWPSFDREIEGNVAFGSDNKLGYSRDEEHCATCGGHLGHVFNDGPRDTTGKRHCINGVTLKFIPKNDE